MVLSALRSGQGGGGGGGRPCGGGGWAGGAVGAAPPRRPPRPPRPPPPPRPRRPPARRPPPPPPRPAARRAPPPGRKAAAGEQGWTFGPRPSGGCATRRLCGTRGGLQPRNASFSAKKNSEVRDACSSSRGSSSRERRRPPLAPRREPSRQQGCADACDACSSSRHPPKQRLLRAQDLDGGGRVLGQVCEGAGVADEARTHQLADERAEVGGHGVHLVCTAAERSKGTSGMMHGGERRAR